ncbi:MAG: UvrY/SirA/GacA family response regulator transcription factor [Legionellales bacterium]|nr:UvrY/SirA/GacA family response regulator transcription factor [Legionellales bacterium]
MKVILVDDHDLVRTGIKLILQDAQGITVVGEADTGEEAVKIAKEIAHDVILLDIMMPGIGGLGATGRLKRACPDSKILIVTICNNENFPSKLLQAGASGYITKGASQQEIVQAIRAVHTGQLYLSQDIANLLAVKHLSNKGESPFDQLSERELQVSLMIATGVKVQDISTMLHLSPKTVNSYRYRVFEKTGVENDVSLALLAIRHGLISNDKDNEFNPNEEKLESV